MTDEYTIRTYPHGVAVFGPVPLGDCKDLGRAWKRKGFTEMLPGVATALGATLAVSSKAGAKAWMEQVEKDAGGDWLRGWDTGTSSRTIYAVLAGRPDAVADHGPSVPYDEDDFGRCHRLLERYPGWRERLPEVAARYPEWGPLVREWATLTELHGRGGVETRAEFGRLIDALVAEGRKAVTP